MGMDAKKLKIGIVGAGIGGLTAAIALQKKGFTVVVHEQARQLKEVGAGLTITSNAAKVFDALGLGKELDALDPPTPHMGALDYKTGERLAYDLRDIPKEFAQNGQVTRQVHRADLHDLLAHTFKNACDNLHMDHELAQIQQGEDGVKLSFTNGQTEGCDIVIGCDGLKSVVRDNLFETSPAEFTGFVAWRGLVNRARVPDISLDPHFCTYSSEDKLFARYPVRQGSLVNYVAIARKPEFTSESWKEKASVSEVLNEFGDWANDVVNIISATPKDECMRWALYTRAPLDSFINERVCLLGDAAHPTSPFYGMGAAMAIEDACILARCFDASDEWKTAFARYQAARLERCHIMQQISAARADMYMNPNPDQRAQLPSAGLGNLMQYDPVTAPI